MTIQSGMARLTMANTSAAMNRAALTVVMRSIGMSGGGAVGFRTREACFESRVWPAKVDALALSLIGFVFILYLCFAKCSGIMELWKYERERERDMERCIFQCRSTFKYRLAELNRVFFMGLYSNLVVL